MFILLYNSTPWPVWTQTAASTASWPAFSASSWHSATWWWRRPRAARARQRLAAAVAAPTTWATTAALPVTWTVASWMPAASPRIAWKSVWNAAASASPHREACAGADQGSSVRGITGPWMEEWKEIAAAVTLNSATDRGTVWLCVCVCVCLSVMTVEWLYSWVKHALKDLFWHWASPSKPAQQGLKVTPDIWTS